MEILQNFVAFSEYMNFTRMDDAHANLQLLFQIALVLEGLRQHVRVGWKNVTVTMYNAHAFQMNIVCTYTYPHDLWFCYIFSYNT